MKLTLSTLVILLALTASAQKIGTPTETKEVKNKTVAVLPLMFWEVDKGEREYVNTAREPYEKALFGTFEKAGISRMEQAKVNNAWRNMKGSAFSTALFQIPQPEDLVRLGKDLGVDYVAVSRCHWLIRTPWVGLGPKTKAHSTVDLWIVDVKKSEFSLKADQIKSDSTERAPEWRLAVDLFVAPISAFSGGPKTDHEKRAGVLSLGKALQPWLEKQQVQDTNTLKIGG